MAAIFSSTPLFSKLPPPFSAAKVTAGVPPSLPASSHTFSQQLGFPLRAPAFSPINSNGTVSFSQLGDRFDDLGLRVQTCIWKWKGFSIRYQCSGDDGPALVLIHGFGANSDHWRKNIPALAESHRVYAIDLIGYGYSDKPNPDIVGESFYTFETWASQLNDFCVDVVQDEAFFICNSIGGLETCAIVPKYVVGLSSDFRIRVHTGQSHSIKSHEHITSVKRKLITFVMFFYSSVIPLLFTERGVVGLQAADMKPQICKGIVLLNISLRMLHIKKQPWYGKPLIRSFQNLLRNTALGKYFFRTVATPEAVKNILSQCYHDTSQVTDELVQIILNPGLQPGAADVFLEFICYSGGPLPEELLPRVKCPVLIGWGDKDPWEPIELGRNYESFESVEDFVVIPNVGHCPQDEAPHLVNPLVESFVLRHATRSTRTSSAV